MYLFTSVSPACYSIWVINLILLQTTFNICIGVHSLHIVPLTYRLFNHDQIYVQISPRIYYCFSSIFWSSSCLSVFFQRVSFFILRLTYINLQRNFRIRFAKLKFEILRDCQIFEFLRTFFFFHIFFFEN